MAQKNKNDRPVKGVSMIQMAKEQVVEPEPPKSSIQQFATKARENVHKIASQIKNSIKKDATDSTHEVDFTVQEMSDFLVNNSQLWQEFKAKVADSNVTTNSAAKEIFKKFADEKVKNAMIENRALHEQNQEPEQNKAEALKGAARRVSMTFRSTISSLKSDGAQSEPAANDNDIQSSTNLENVGHESWSEATWDLTKDPTRSSYRELDIDENMKNLESDKREGWSKSSWDLTMDRTRLSYRALDVSERSLDTRGESFHSRSCTRATTIEEGSICFKKMQRRLSM